MAATALFTCPERKKYLTARINLTKSPERNVTFGDEYVTYFFKFMTTAQREKGIKSSLSDELNAISDKCKEDGWACDDNDSAKGISDVSVQQAQTFIEYIKNVPAPFVVPYYDGDIGFEWNIKNNIVISIVFTGNDQFIFSIISPSGNVYGSKLQNAENQKEFMNTISKVLMNAE